MSRARWCLCLACVAVTALLGAGAAAAHQTLSNNGVSVTLHVNPNDEPIAGAVSDVLILKVKTRTGTFSWATCRCTMRISDSSRNVLRSGRVQPRNTFVFPDPAAYEIQIAGRVLRKGKWAFFKVAFAIRADPA